MNCCALLTVLVLSTTLTFSLPLSRVVAQQRSAFEFVDSTARSGICARHFDGGGTQAYLPQLMVAGLALFDFDNDGWNDIYLLNGRSLRQSHDAHESTSPEVTGNTLYRNNHDGTFSDVTQHAGVAGIGFGLGAVAADLDNDGDQDLITSNFGSNEIFINNGDGTFDSSQRAGVLAGPADQFGAGLCCLDIDNDGLLDVFSSNYVEFSFERYEQPAQAYALYPPGPKDFPPAADRLLLNHGDGDFVDVSESSGIRSAPGPSMGTVSGDFDGDGDVDIFVCSDAAPNQLFINDGTGRFVDGALAAGAALDLNGNANGSMGVDAGDYDNDGLVDLLITNYTGQMPVFYRNLGEGLFEDSSRVSRIGRAVFAHTKWGVGLVDFDNDRDLDVFYANGHFLKNIETIDDRTAFCVRNTLMANDGEGHYFDVSSSAGNGMEIVESSRGAGFDDMDNDGDIDIVVLNANALPSYLENRTPGDNAWINIRLVGTKVNRDAVGAAVRIVTADGNQVAMVHAGRGYQSHYGSVLHFGLGRVPSVSEIQVTWPGGKRECFECRGLRHTLLLVEGQGVRGP